MTRARSFISCMFGRLMPIAPRGALSSCTLLLQEGKLSVSAHIKSSSHHIFIYGVNDK